MILVNKYLSALIDCCSGIDTDTETESKFLFRENRIILDCDSSIFRFYEISFNKEIKYKKEKKFLHYDGIEIPLEEELNYFKTLNFSISNIRIAELKKLLDENYIFDIKDEGNYYKVFYVPYPIFTDIEGFKGDSSYETKIKLHKDISSQYITFDKFNYEETDRFNHVSHIFNCLDTKLFKRIIEIDTSELVNSSSAKIVCNNIVIKVLKKNFPKIVASSKLYVANLKLPDNKVSGLLNTHLFGGRVEYKANKIKFLGKIIDVN